MLKVEEVRQALEAAISSSEAWELGQYFRDKYIVGGGGDDNGR